MEYQDRILELIDQARPASEILAELEDDQFQADLELVIPLLQNPLVLVVIVSSIESNGPVFERINIALLHLAIVSRICDRPINIKVEGPSSGGKSYLTNAVVRSHDPEAVETLTAGSERALIYSETQYKNRFIYFQEARGASSGDIAQAIIHELAWGNRIKYVTVESSSSGLYARTIEKEGPTGFIATTTKPLDDETETRVLTINVQDTEDQNKAVLQAVAARHNGSKPAPPAYDQLHAVSRVLKKPVMVTIPWGHWLAEQVPAKAVAIRRAFELFLSLVEASAILHQYQRQRSSSGEIIANVADYAIARCLAEDSLLAVNQDGITPKQWEAISAVRDLYDEAIQNNTPAGAKLQAISSRLGICKEATRQRLNSPRKLGFVINQETRKGYPASYIPGSERIEKHTLPKPEELAAEFPDLTDNWQDIIDFLEGNDLPPNFGLDTLTVPADPIQHTMEGTVKVADLDGLLAPEGSGPEVPCRQGSSKDLALDGSVETESIVDSPHRQGVKVENRPDEPCFACGSTNWWHRPSGERVCGRCHPKPPE